MSRRPVRVLCLDQEGGHGGASRSLYSVLSNMDRNRIAPEVWCRRGGKIESMYRAISVPCRVEAGLPALSSQPRTLDNLVEYARFFRRFRGARLALADLGREIEARFDVVHFNHEGFWWLARWLRRRVVTTFTMHVRTRPIDTQFARWQARTIARTLGRLVFITENERRHFESLAGSAAGEVIYNCVPRAGTQPRPHPEIPADERLKVASMSNYSWARGVDRLVDVARALARMGRTDILFVVAGDMRLTRRLPGTLGEIGRRGGTLANYAAANGVLDMFCFLGHVSEPERVLAGCDLVARLSREENPWGRDIIEAMHMAKPVVTLGHWSGFVEDGETGVMHGSFDADRIAAEITRLADDPAMREQLGGAARERVLRLCSGPERAADLAKLWEEVAGDLLRDAPAPEAGTKLAERTQ